jgi:hypothetical protein
VPSPQFLPARPSAPARQPAVSARSAAASRKQGSTGRIDSRLTTAVDMRLSSDGRGEELQVVELAGRVGLALAGRGPTLRGRMPVRVAARGSPIPHGAFEPGRRGEDRVAGTRVAKPRCAMSVRPAARRPWARPMPAFLDRRDFDSKILSPVDGPSAVCRTRVGPAAGSSWSSGPSCAVAGRGRRERHGGPVRGRTAGCRNDSEHVPSPVVEVVVVGSQGGSYRRPGHGVPPAARLPVIHINESSAGRA